MNVVDWGKKVSFEKFKSKKNLFFFIVLLLLVVLRLGLYLNADYFANLYGSYDDGHYIHLADELISGNWLGDYNATTLSKGISYALFLAGSYKLHLPYSLSFGLLQIFAAFLAAQCFKPIVKSQLFFSGIFIFFLYSPITFMDEYSTRIYRNALVVPVAVIIIACTIGIYLRRDGSIKKFALWMSGLVVALPFFWYLREDSIWIFPFVAGGLFFAIVQLILTQQKQQPVIDVMRRKIAKSFITKILPKILVCALPFISILVTTKILVAINDQHYGVAMVNDRSDGEFVTLMSYLIRLDDGTDLNQKDNKIWITRQAVKKAEQVSPTLQKMKVNTNWIFTDSVWATADKQVSGDYFFWGFREALKQRGYYNNNAEQTDNLLKKINHELSEAYREQKITTKKEFYLTKSGDGKIFKDFPGVFNLMGVAIGENLDYGSYEQGRNILYSSKKDRKIAEKILDHSFSGRWQSAESEPISPPIALTGRVANRLILVANLIKIPIIIISIFGLGLMVLGSIFSKKQQIFYRDHLLITVGLGLTYIVFLFGVAWFCSFGETAQIRQYFMRVYTGVGVSIMQFIAVFSGLHFVKLFNRKKIKK
ncbi:hypothetical protein KUA55_01520 [Enterococcus sp. ALS3]|uniref:Glucosyltransferase n=1 Tax=Enterococcus alishanensis TaxID=1303817 RepID=A0ABS6T8W8_9ENTE|nr:hypothetical protein [Enterococcus alishanensis]MBV7389344.1 hypothetical protein [Enterococcus alishanensis]